MKSLYLKKYAELLAKYLSLLFSESLEKGVEPKDRLVAPVAPAFKAGKQELVNIYPPTSLTSTSCKLLEQSVKKHFIFFFEEANILHPGKPGFRSDLSTVTQLVESFHHFSTAVNNEQQVDAVFPHLSKAFDRVSHTKSLNILENVRVNSSSFKINSCLSWQPSSVS